MNPVLTAMERARQTLVRDPVMSIGSIAKRAGLISVASLFGPIAFADVLIVKLQPATIAAWDRYHAWAEERVRRQVSDPARFLARDHLSGNERKKVAERLRAGDIVVQRVSRGIVPPGQELAVPGGEIHHVWGIVMLPGVKMPELLRFLQDYDHHGGNFADVERSRLISRKNGHFRIFYRLSRSKAFFTACYNTEQEAEYRTVGPGRVFSWSNATRIAELENPGTPEERERPPGDDHGFLWRLVSWWRCQETEDGVIVECESASLSRDVPAMVSWIPGLGRYIRSTPVESLESVLSSIRNHFRR
ncbi:MAG: hypothetical protein HXY20_04705 [Acidobacteria bacterium]|nr:hypothetical protein [Acidobacteriota bacterium]